MKEEREHIFRSNDFQKMAEIDAQILEEKENLKKLKEEMKHEISSN